jgi:hypothetical protein
MASGLLQPPLPPRGTMGAMSFGRSVFVVVLILALAGAPTLGFVALVMIPLRVVEE